MLLNSVEIEYLISENVACLVYPLFLVPDLNQVDLFNKEFDNKYELERINKTGVFPTVITTVCNNMIELDDFNVSSNNDIIKSIITNNIDKPITNNTNNNTKQLQKSLIFKKLITNWFISNGSKFSADFLVYPV